MGRDSLVGIALTLALITIKGESLSEICSAYPKYGVIRYKQAFSGDFASLINI